MSAAPRFAGRPVQLGGQSFTAAPLALGAVKRLAAEIEAYGALPMAKQLDVAGRVLHASLQRNHPELTIEQVEDLVDMANVQDLMTEVLALSGYAPKKTDAEPGNALGQMPGTGQPSMPTLPPASAGPSSTSTTTSP